MSNNSLFSDTIPKRKGGVELANSSTRYDWAFNNLNAIGSDLSRMRPRIPSAACYILGGFLNYETRYHTFSFNTWQYSPEMIARNIESDDIEAWTNSTIGSEFYAESSSILRTLEVAYSLDVPLATFVFFYTLEKRCDSKIKQQRARDVIRTYFASSREECINFLRTLESGEGYSLVNSQSVPSDIELENGLGAIRLDFCVREPPAEQVLPTSKASTAPVAGTSEEEAAATKAVDKKEGKEEERLGIAKEKDDKVDRDVVYDETSKDEAKINEWGMLLRIGILYVGLNPSEGNNIKRAKADWLAIKQGKNEAFEAYVADERQHFEVLSVACEWAGIDVPSDYDRIVHFISNLSSDMASYYTKLLRKHNRRAEELTYKDVIADLTNISIGMSINFPWERSSTSTSSQPSTTPDVPNKKEKEKRNSVSTNINSGKDAKPTKSDSASSTGHHHQQERHKKWCKYCEREVYHKPEHCWKRSQGTKNDKAPSTSSKNPTDNATSETTNTTNNDKSSIESRTATGKQYPLRPTPQRQPGFSYTTPSPQRSKAGEETSGSSSKNEAPAKMALAMAAMDSQMYEGASNVRSIIVNGNDVKGNVVPCIAAIDSLCEVSVLNARSISKLKYEKLEREPEHLRTFDGNVCELSKSVRLTLTTGNVSRTVDLYVFPLGDYMDLVIGADLLSSWRCSMDWSRKAMVFPEGDTMSLVPLSLASAYSSINPITLDLPVPPEQLDNFLGDLPQPDLEKYFSLRLEGFDPPMLDFDIEGDDVPYQTHMNYTIPPQYREGMEVLLRNAEAEGVLSRVEYRDDQFISPAFIKSKDRYEHGVLVCRLLSDLRFLNARVKAPLDWVSECPSLSSFIRSISTDDWYYCCLDIRNAYHTVRLAPRCRRFLTIRIASRIYQYNVMAQGLSLSALYFGPHLSRCFNRLFQEVWRTWMVIWVDDIFIHANSLERAQKREKVIRVALRMLNKEVSSKSQPAADSADCVGLHFHHGHYSLSDASLMKLKKILDIKPQSVSEVRRLVGVILYSSTAFRFPPTEQSQFPASLAPLNALIASTRKRFVWTDEAEKSVSNLREHLDNLELKQFSFQDLLHGTWACLTDASNVGCGACLFYIDPSVPAANINIEVIQDTNVSSLVSVMSHGFSSSERRLHTFEQESLSLVLCWRRWGKLWLTTAREKPKNTINVVLMSDSMTTISRFDSYTVLDDPLSNIKARRFLSWIQELEETRYAGIVYRHVSGVLNALPDILSRFHDQLDRQAERRLIKPSTAIGYALTAPGSSPFPDSVRVNHLSLNCDQVATLALLQRSDETTYQGIRIMDIMKVIDKDKLNVPLDLPKIAERKIRSWLYHSMWPVQHPNTKTTAMDGGQTLLYVLSSSRTLSLDDINVSQQPRLVVLLLPKDSSETTFRKDALQEAHGSAHVGVSACQSELLRWCWWPGCLVEVKKYINNCSCRENLDPVSSARNYGTIPVVSHRFQAIAFDHKSIPSYVHCTYTDVLTIVDLASGYVIYEAVHSVDAVETGSVLLRRWVSRFSLPDVVVSDLAPAFVSKTFNVLCDLMGWKHKTVGVHNAQANGVVERKNALLSYIFKISRGSIHNDGDLMIWLSVAEMSMNQIQRQSSGQPGECSCAHERLFGESPRRHISTSPEVNIDDLSEKGKAWINQLKLAVNALVEEYGIFRSEKALYNLRAQRAELARRRKLNVANRTDIEVGSTILFEDQERVVKEIHYNELLDPIMVTLDDGSRVQVSSITAVRSVDRQPNIVTKPSGIFNEGVYVFYRQRNPDYVQDEGPEWMIHLVVRHICDGYPSGREHVLVEDLNMYEQEDVQLKDLQQ